MISKRLFSTLKNVIGYDLILNSRQLCDYECIVNRSFNPLSTFLNKKDYFSVLKDARLSNGKLWPMPITLDISKETMKSIEETQMDKICLRDKEFNLLAVMNLEEIFENPKKLEADLVFGGDPEHPAINYIKNSGEFFISGPLDVHQNIIHYDYNHIRFTPNDIKQILPNDKPIVAFQTRNPMHKAHIELVGAAAKSVDGIALIHPVVGLTKPGDIDYHTRIKCYQELLKDGYLKTQSGNIESKLSLLPLAMRMGGPREALWHALIRQNYGATHFICGRDHAGPGSNSKGKDFYTPYEARDYLNSFQNELDINILSFEMMVYNENNKKYIPVNKVNKKDKVLNLSGTEFRKRLKTGQEIPKWFSDENVVKILRDVYPSSKNQGFTLFFTGLSGSGKSTIANGLLSKLYEKINRPITLLDGDEVRTFLSSELSFSDKDRDLNIKRIGFVASEINKSRGIVICAAIAPFTKSRETARKLVEEKGGKFVEIFVDVGLDVCEKRDRKGLYNKARKGLIPKFTGIDSPYEKPKNAEIIIQSDKLSIKESVDQIYEYLREINLI